MVKHCYLMLIMVLLAYGSKITKVSVWSMLIWARSDFCLFCILYAQMMPCLLLSSKTHRLFEMDSKSWSQWPFGCCNWIGLGSRAQILHNCQVYDAICSMVFDPYLKSLLQPIKYVNIVTIKQPDCGVPGFRIYQKAHFA